MGDFALSSLKDQTDQLAELEKYIGVEREDVGVDAVTLSDIRHKLEVYCVDCPLHFDEEVARAHGYRTVVAPVAMTSLWAVPPYWQPGEPPPYAPGKRERNGTRREAAPVPFTRGFNAASEWEAYEPLYPGDVLRITSKLVKVEPKTTRVGAGAFITNENRVTKQTGDLVMISRGTAFRYDPLPDVVESARSAPVEDPPPTEQPAESSPVVDWSRQIRFDEVQVGDEVPPYSIWLNYQRLVMSVSADRIFSSIHHNREIARDGGLNDIIFNTKGYEMMFEITLRRWMGWMDASARWARSAWSRTATPATRSRAVRRSPAKS
jgi:3-methylfumaryl-CoA hydratase